jgi:DNA-binding NarL/FixJ family response regulator
MNTQIEVLTIGRPSRFRDSIHLLLASMSLIEKIHLADDVASALEVKAVLAVVVVDAAVGNGRLPAVINTIKTAWPQAGLIILVEDELEFQVAQAAGSDALLRKGFPAAKFIAAVEALLTK